MGIEDRDYVHEKWRRDSRQGRGPLHYGYGLRSKERGKRLQEKFMSTKWAIVFGLFLSVFGWIYESVSK